MFRSSIFRSFEDVPSHYEKLFVDMDSKNFFYGGRFFKNFCINTIEPTAQIHIYAVEDEAPVPQARGVLFMRSPAGQMGSIFQGWRVGARTVSSMTNHQSVFFAPLVRDSDDQFDIVISNLVAAVCNDRQNWTMIDLNLLDPESRVYASMIRALNEHDMIVRCYEYRPSCYERVSGISFDDFVASRTSMVRKTILRKARQLERTGQLRFHVTLRGVEIDSAIADYEKVLANSWKEPEPFPNHTTGLIRAAAAAGALRLGLLYLTDRPVATQLWIVSSGKATIYKLHYDAEFKDQSVGAILTLRMFEQVIEGDHVEEINFGVGNETAKHQWLTDERPLCGVVAFNPRTFGGLYAFFRFTTEKFARIVKNWLKPFLMPLLQQLNIRIS